MPLFKKTSPRRTQVRKKTVEKQTRLNWLTNSDVIISIIIALVFVAVCIPLLSFQFEPGISNPSTKQITFPRIFPVAVLIIFITLATACYIHHYQGRLIKNHTRTMVLAGLFLILLATAKLGAVIAEQPSWATGSAIAIAIILSISYNQRSAIGMSIIYSTFACLAAGNETQINLFLIMAAGAITCCFCLKEIRTRMKLLEVSAITTTVIFITSVAADFWLQKPHNKDIFFNAGYHAIAAFVVGLLMQSLLPFIEKHFHVVTNMTLLDYSDANQPLLRKLAMEAPGTFSHGLLVGSIVEAAAESIGRNGLLCRVGAYYHDIGKLNKPSYFTENELGAANKHKELSAAMSQLIIVGHVKDGIELAREYGLPSVLRQFIETHHGTTLIEFFYNQAKKQRDEKQAEPSESEFRYPGPKPRTKEAAIVMLSDSVEGATRSMTDLTPTKIEAIVHNMAMKRLQDGQFDECDLSLRDLSMIEASMAKTLAAHYHARIAYPKSPDLPADFEENKQEKNNKKQNGNEQNNNNNNNAQN